MVRNLLRILLLSLLPLLLIIIIIISFIEYHSYIDINNYNIEVDNCANYCARSAGFKMGLTCEGKSDKDLYSCLCEKTPNIFLSKYQSCVTFKQCSATITSMASSSWPSSASSSEGRIFKDCIKVGASLCHKYQGHNVSGLDYPEIDMNNNLRC